MSDNPPPPPPVNDFIEFIKEKKNGFDNEENTPTNAPTPPFMGDFEGFKVEKKKEKEKKKKIIFSDYKSFDISKDVNWSEIKNVSVTDDGSNGVFFLLTESKELFVVKGSSFLCEEIFSSKLAKYLNICCPKVTLIEYQPVGKKTHYKYGNEWWGSKLCIEEFSKNDLRLKMKFEKNLNRAFYLKMGFVHGKSFYEFDPKKYFSSSKILRSLGSIFIFDVIINNWDRFCNKYLWNHEGNEYNFLFCENKVVAIDQSCVPIKKNCNIDYLKGVQKLIEQHFSFDIENNEFIKSICDFIYDKTHFKVSEEGKKDIWKGMEETIHLAKKNLSKKRLKKIKRDVEMLKTGVDWENVYKDSLKRIDIEFICKILDIFKIS